MKGYFRKGIYLFPIIVILSCEKEVSVSEPYDFETGYSKYYISSYPQGASIYVDDKPTGLFTPDTLKWLKEGEHTFKLRLDPFLDYSFTDISENSTMNKTEYDFYSDPQNFGSLYFTSTPDSCTIFLNDSLMDFKTPYILNKLLPGDYKVKYSFPEHRSDSTIKFIYGGKQAKVVMTLSDTTVWVTYNADNSDIPDNTITDIFIDSDRTMWIGTRHSGIIKISGGKKEFFNTTNSNLPSNIIHCFSTDINNVMWIGTYSGIAKYTNNTFNTLTTVNSGLPNNYIFDIVFDAQQNMWIGTRDGLVKYDGSSWNVYNNSNSSIPGNIISKILFDQEDSLWIGTYSNNTSIFNGIDFWKSYQSDSLEIGDTVADLIIGNNGRLWVGLIPEFSKPGVDEKPGGLYLLQKDELVEIELYLTSKRINKFYLDDTGILWIGTRAGLVSLATKDDFRVYNNLNAGLPINDVVAIAKDNDGNFWLGTNGGGLVKYKIGNE